MHVFGMDVGFAKTGLTVFDVHSYGDVLIAAHVLRSECEPMPHQASEDVARCQNLVDQLDNLFNRYKPAAIFAEIPGSSAQSARAGRCMALATGWIASYVAVRRIPHDFMIPSVVEKLVGIKLDPNDAKGMKANERQKWKKERSKNVVVAAFPDFAGWPPQVTLAEDAYDSAAAFMAGRIKNQLYKQILKVGE